MKIRNAESNVHEAIFNHLVKTKIEREMDVKLRNELEVKRQGIPLVKWKIRKGKVISALPVVCIFLYLQNYLYFSVFFWQILGIILYFPFNFLKIFFSLYFCRSD